MKIHSIEIQKIKAASATHSGQVVFKIDATVAAKEPIEGIEPSSILTLNEATARVLMAALKSQLADLDAKKPKSRHGRHG